MSGLINKTNDIRNALEGEADYLENLGHAFTTSGNNTVGMNMRAVASSLRKLAEMLKTAVDEDLDAKLKTAKEGSAAMLQAVFAGIELGHKDAAPPTSGS